MTRVSETQDHQKWPFRPHKHYRRFTAVHPDTAYLWAASFYKDELPVCGARCRDGHPCRARAAWDDDHMAPRNGRCRLHGGLSTGPRTPEGKRRVGEAARQRAQQKRKG